MDKTQRKKNLDKSRGLVFKSHLVKAIEEQIEVEKHPKIKSKLKKKLKLILGISKSTFTHKVDFTAIENLFNTKSDKVNKKKNKPIHSPKKTAENLSKLSSDPILRLSTHEFDELTEEQKEILGGAEFNLLQYRKHLNESFENIKLPTPLWIKLKLFLLGTFDDNKGWSESKILFGWGHSDLDTWCKDNPNIWPSSKIGNNMNFAAPISFGNGRNQFIANSFKDIIIKLKKDIQFRKEINPLGDLGFLLEDEFEKQLKITNKLSNDVFIYTDTEKVLQALRKMLKMFFETYGSEGKEKKEIEIESYTYKTPERCTIISIRLEDEKYKKSTTIFEDRHLKKEPEGDFTNAILDTLNSLCDIELRAKFDDDIFGKATLLPKNSQKIEHLDEKFEKPFVEFRLKFYPG